MKDYLMATSVKPYQRLVRSYDDRKIAGVAAGIGDYFGIDHTLVRIAFVALAFTSVSIFLYPLLWLLMPRDESAIDDDEPESPGIWSILLKAAVIIGSVVLISEVASDFTFAAFAAGLLIGLFFLYRGISSAVDHDEEGTGIHRSASNSKIMGVFGGLGESLGVDPTLLRIAGAILLLVGFPLILPAYLIFGILVPKREAVSGEWEGG
jgi:phage shock protein C